VVTKSGKLSRRELSERNKRIPQRTQEILRKMIGRRRAELDSTRANGTRLAESCLRELRADPAPEAGARQAPADKAGD
jgi:hypothetical protein